MGTIKAIYLLVRAFLLPRLILAAENIALRQQVALEERSQHGSDRPWAPRSVRLVVYEQGLG